MKVNPGKPSDVLLSLEELADYEDKIEDNKEQAPKRAKTDNRGKYKMEHLVIFISFGLAWPPAVSAIIAANIDNCDCTVSEAEVMYLCVKVFPITP